MRLADRAQRFRSRQIEIEAIRFDGSNGADICEWIGLDRCQFRRGPFGEGLLAILTPEGVARAHKGDWVVKGPAGECYPYRAEFLEAKFESTGAVAND